jgi:hypothetical protein
MATFLEALLARRAGTATTGTPEQLGQLIALAWIHCGVGLLLGERPVVR